MSVDVRFIVSCSLGTLISGNIADDYVQGTGLVLVRGSIELSGLVTPAVGTAVTFSYTRNGATRNLPRKLRVLSSFADPFRRTTRVELGCKLTYLQDKRDEIKWEAFDDPENSSLTQADAEIITIPIRASSVMTKCLQELGITASSNPLTNKFSVAEFDFSAGYVTVLGNLLASECFCGYLDRNEVLQVFSVNQEGGTGPVMAADNIIDLAAVNSGQLPGEAVVVRYSSLRLSNTTTTGGGGGGDDEEFLNWTRSETSATSQVVISYISPVSNSRLQAVYNTLDTSEEFTDYQPLVIINKEGRQETVEVVQSRVTTKTQTAASVLGSVIVQFLEKGLTPPSGQLTTTIQESYVYDAFGNEIESRRSTYASLGYAWGSAGLPVVLYQAGQGGQFQFVPVTINTGGTYLQEEIITETLVYEDYRKRVVYRLGPWMNTLVGQQALAEGRPSFTTTQQVESYFNTLYNGRFLIDVNVQTERSTSGAQTAPPKASRNLQRGSKESGNPANGYRTESKAELTLALGSATAQRRVEFNLPYAPDDTFVKNGSTYSTVASDAEAKAQAFGRTQNRLLLGNRSGMNLQLSPLDMPEAPFSPLVVQANGLSGLYRTNGTSYTFSQEGLVASCDALFWGAVGGTGTFWFPVAPGITQLPTTPPTTTTNVTGTDASGNTVVIGTQTTTTVGGVIKPFNETVVLAPVTRTRLVVESLGYGLQLSTPVAVTTRTRAVVQPLVLLQLPATTLAITTAVPTVAQAGAVVSLPATSLALTAGAPSVESISAGVLLPVTTLNVTTFIPVVAQAGVNVALTSTNINVTIPVPIANASDPFRSTTGLSLHMDGANNSTTITNSGNATLTVTANGTAKISTAQSVFGGASALFDGSGWISVASNDALSLSGDFTIELRFYQQTTFVENFPILVERGATESTTNYGIILNNQDSPKTAAFFYGSPRQYIDMGSIGLAEWRHLSVSRSGSTIRTFNNGTLVATATLSNNFTSTATLMIAQAGAGTSNRFRGHIDELSISKAARRTAAFTVPTQPLPDVGEYDDDALVYIAAVETADGQSLETSVKQAIDAFIRGCKADGVWSAIKASCILAGARTLSGALVPLVGSAPTNFNFVTGDYSRKTGLLGNGTNKYIDSNRANNADPQNNKHISVYVTAAATGNTTQVFIGSDTSNTPGTSLIYKAGSADGSNDKFIANHHQDSPPVPEGAAANSGFSTGLFGISRSASASFTGRVAGANTTYTQESETPSSTDILVYARTASAPARHCTARIAYYSIGESVNLAQLEARVAALIAALGTALP